MEVMLQLLDITHNSIYQQLNKSLPPNDFTGDKNQMAFLPQKGSITHKKVMAAELMANPTSDGQTTLCTILPFQHNGGHY